MAAFCQRYKQGCNRKKNVSKDGLLPDLVVCEVMPTTWVHTD